MIDDLEIEPENEEVDVTTSSNVLHSLSEHDLYPFLIEFLKSELKLHSMRIDEKRSKNSKGAGGNQWLHPDIVAMKIVNDAVENCVQQGGGQRVRLWSFEVKKALTGSNVRKSFFQAVSNSSWANEGGLSSYFNS
ncbi:hypothetical protein NOW39_003175 [Vibrio parahaemolyticus]|uniref:hypothetical protein n=1 Tax=Vibrio parahaemolyticus TaxID=670 RepID=UPI001C5E0A7B|nr:hypothetical protein [Vibrio parahaemolyticus]EJM7153673.1 hypothetical protein [Vibrio parahaemolyticus]HCG7064668.1 hypothetical protein [Vibrio parahaemolyticus]HCH2794846.1 hypothetical protein [Vibrio parahaemolyticus]HCH2799307.1 hypothetical protein [Vibrio parahaemolyticus]